MVVAWLGLYFVSAKHSLAAHKVMLVVYILSHLRYLTSHAFIVNYCGNAHQPRILQSSLSILLTIYVHTNKVLCSADKLLVLMLEVQKGCNALVLLILVFRIISVI